jgi:acyl-CoA reductase-like NAD-dependent aldehyde dehydrogenase
MQFDRVSGLVDDAVRSGANVAAGGGPIAKDGGYYYQPTILSNVTEGMRVVDEEQFGPVLPVIKYSNVDEVVARANNTTYGLGSSVWGPDPVAATKVGMGVEAGMTWINTHLASVEVAPFGGIKASGVGREGGGHIGLKEFVDMKTVIIAK